MRSHLWGQLALAALLGWTAPLSAGPATLESLAGSYYQGDGRGVNRKITIQPDGTYFYSWHGCLGLYESAYGRISLEDGDVVVLGPAEKGGEGGLSLRVRVVSWGERTYLVPEADLPDFANRISQGSEPRSRRNGFFYLREGDWERPATASPRISRREP